MPHPPETITLRGVQSWFDRTVGFPETGPAYVRLEEHRKTNTTYMYMLWQTPKFRLVSYTEDSGPDLRESP